MAAAITGAYPRSRGGTETIREVRMAIWGLSPLTRGNRYTIAKSGATGGPIPAHAGEPT